MDAIGISSIPLVYIDRAILSGEIVERQKKLEQKAKSIKLLITKDPESHTYTQYKLKLKKEISCEDINKVYRLIDQMLNSRVVGCQLLQEEKTAVDLKNAFSEMLFSNTLCFNKLVDIYNTSNNIVIEEPIRVFLGLFDVNEKKEYTQEQLENRIDRISCKNMEKAYAAMRDCVASAPYNTTLIRNIQNRRIRYAKERKKSETLTREIAKQKRK